MEEVKEIKLNKKNKIKYCSNCHTMVKIKMIGKEGFCPNCNSHLYSVESRGRGFR